MNYSIFYRRSIGVDRIEQEVAEFDIFVSAFNSSDRISNVFGKVPAKRKLWLVHPEYQYTQIDTVNVQPSVRPTTLDLIRHKPQPGSSSEPVLA